MDGARAAAPHAAVQAFKDARREIASAADAVVVRATRKPFGPELDRDVGMQGKALGKKAVPVLLGVRNVASQVGAQGEATVAAVKATSKCILDLVNAAKALAGNGTAPDLIAALNATHRELRDLLDTVEREALAINKLLLALPAAAAPAAGE